MQEHDPTNIESDPDAIGPFSVGRAFVLNSGYCGAGSQNVITLLSAAGSYNVIRGLYIIVRQRDVADTTGSFGLPFPWQVGGTKNWVQTMFSGSLSWVARSSEGAAHCVRRSRPVVLRPRSRSQLTIVVGPQRTDAPTRRGVFT